jgi:predicted transcriptional regulator
MLTLPEIRQMLADRNLREVSRRSGVSYMAVYRLATGRSAPRYEDAKAVVEYLQGVTA